MGLGSRIRKKPIPDLGSRGQIGTVSHALSLFPSGIKPGSPASQAGTLPKELSRQLIPVMRIRDVYPRSRILIFSLDSKQQQKRGVKKISCHNFLCSHKFHKITNYFSFELLKKKIWANFQRIIELFNQNCQSRIQDPEKTYSGSWIQGSKRHCIPCIKFASAGDRTRVACVIGGHST